MVQWLPGCLPHFRGGFQATGTPEKAFGECLGCCELTVTGKDPLMKSRWNPSEIIWRCEIQSLIGIKIGWIFTLRNQSELTCGGVGRGEKRPPETYPQLSWWKQNMLPVLNMFSLQPILIGETAKVGISHCRGLPVSGTSQMGMGQNRVSSWHQLLSKKDRPGQNQFDAHFRYSLLKIGTDLAKFCTHKMSVTKPLVSLKQFKPHG